MQETKYIDEKEIHLSYLSEDLHYNRMPKPYREISFEEYMYILDSYYSKYEGLFQVFDETDKVIDGCNVHCNFYSDYGIARTQTPQGYKYYKIGCQHELELIDSDSFERVYKCKKCGTIVTEQTGK